jgi:GxxExxY protein
LEEKYRSGSLGFCTDIESRSPVVQAHDAQLLNYLRATGITVGLLINFKHAKAEINRFVWNAED